MGSIKAQLHSRADLVHILPARPSGTDEIQLNFVFIKLNIWSDLNHGVKYTNEKK